MFCGLKFKVYGVCLKTFLLHKACGVGLLVYKAFFLESCVPARRRSARQALEQAEEGAVEAEEGDEDDDGTVARQKCAPGRIDLFDA